MGRPAAALSNGALLFCKAAPGRLQRSTDKQPPSTTAANFNRRLSYRLHLSNPTLYPPTNIYRADQCKYDPNVARFPTCSTEQFALGFNMAQQLHGGAAMQLAPCELYPYLRNRTLWILGYVFQCAEASGRRK